MCSLAGPDRATAASTLRLLAAVAFILSWTPQPAASQTPLPQLDPNLQITQYIHDTWTVEDGLPQSSVYAFLQKEDGYLWLGTQGGLARFDGFQFETFNKGEAAGLESNEIRTFLNDPEGGFWIGTNGGLTRYRDGRFMTYSTEDGLSSNAVRSLAHGEDGDVWIGTVGGGLVRYDGQAFTTYTESDGLAGSVVLALQVDSTGTLWIGTEAGLSSYRDGRLVTHDLAALDGRVIDAIHPSRDDGLWIGTNEGLVRLQDGNVTRYTREDGLCSNNISTLLEDPAGALWIGTLDNGLCRLYDGRFDHFKTDDGLTLNRIRSLHLGHEGGLWIGTEMGGLNRLRRGKFAPVSVKEGLSHNVAYSVLEDRHGAVWIGTLGGGLNRRDPDGTITHYTVENGLLSNQVVALAEQQDGTLWAGTQGGGLCRRSSQDRFTCLTTEDGLSSNYVFSLYEDRSGSLWIGTNNGLNRLEDGQITTYTQEDGLSSNQIAGMLEDRSGSLWIGTFGGGLNRFREGRFVNYSTDHGLSSSSVLTMHESEDGALWIGTQGGGLCRLHNALFACFDTQDGLHSDDILQILEDDDDNLWLGGMNGIARISRDELDAYARNADRPMQPIVYGINSGLKSSELNGGTQPAAWKSRDGRLWFSSIRGVAVIDPAHIPTNPFPPPVRLKELQVNGRVVPLADSLTLPPGSRDFEFHYTGLSFSAPERIHFQYKLEGYDEDWIDAGNRRDAFYTNLPAGEYRFRLRARNVDGVWNNSGVATAFFVEPFFYETYWFYLLCTGGLGLLVIGAYRFRLRQLKTRELKQLVAEQTSTLRAREQELEKLNSDLEKEVQVQLEEKLIERKRYERQLITAKEKAEESARLKTSILRNMSHEIRTPITAILGYAQILEERLAKQNLEFARHIFQNGQRLLTTINSILDLSKLESDRQTLERETFDLRELVAEETNLLSSMVREKEIDLKTDTPLKDVPVRLNRHAVRRILQNLVGNAIKFTDRGEVVAVVGLLSEDTPFLQVRDTGVGISKEFLPRLFNEFEQESSGMRRSHEGSGLGLAITKRLVDALDGTIRVESEKDKGTTFTITFPGARIVAEEGMAAADGAD